MRRIALAALLIALSCSRIGPADYSGMETKENPGYAPGGVMVRYKLHLTVNQIKSDKSGR